jgi:hypothetical protein
MSNDLVQALVTAHEADEDGHSWIVIDAEIRIQVVQTEDDLRIARRNQKAAFVTESRSLFVWSDKADNLLSDADDLLTRMMDTIWTKRNEKKRKIPSNLSPVSRSTMSSSKSLAALTTSSTPPGSPQGSEHISDVVTDNQTDRFGKSEDFEAQEATRRPIMLFAPMTTGLAIILAFAIVGASIGELYERTILRHNMFDSQFCVKANSSSLICWTVMPRASPCLPCCLFPCVSPPASRHLFTVVPGDLSADMPLDARLVFLTFIVGQLWQLVGPVSNLNMNSQFYSGKRPEPRPNIVLPDFTIVMPVYKESLEAVIMPTVDSLNQAILTYERQGGSARILICEDGMQCISPELQSARKDYYERQSIAWIARPPHSDAYIRKGRFKKASNMNFACELSLRVEELMAGRQDESDGARDGIEYEEALDMAMKESEGKAWAAGNVRLQVTRAMIILLDTRLTRTTGLFQGRALAHCGL